MKGSDELADTEVGSGPSITPVPPQGSVGRFRITGELGAGGMGVVVAAYDPQLDRQVAIKMLHEEINESHGARLEREAKAMAQLAHPNVVTVHETGTFEGRLYIAMEFVDGQTLRTWLRAKPRTQDEIIDMMMQAGRGLAAAHAAGLVHRDFKPDNVLVGKDGRARVSDFGLASASLGPRTSDLGPRPEPEPEARRPRPEALTLTGAVVGTPLYMAPEQHDGRAADAKADQFAFCVTLWQALTDDLPYGADTYEDLVKNVTGGKLRPIPKGVRVAPKVRSILGRGLSADPRERFPSMQALLDALERARRRVRWPLLAAGGVALAGAGVAGALVLRGGDRDPCPPAGDRVAAVWSGARASSLEAAFTATQAPNAAAAWAGIRDHVDRYTSRWLDGRVEVCRATRVRGEQSAELFDLRVRCLDNHLGELDALLGQLAHVDRASLYRAVDAAAGLPTLVDCDDVDRLRAMPLPADPAAREQVAALERRVADVGALDRMGRFAQGLELLTPLLGDAERAAYPPLVAKTKLMFAGEQFRLGNLAAAEAAYHDAAAAAARAKDDARIAQAWIDLMQDLAAQGRIPDALALVDTAHTSVERADQPKLGARFSNVLAGVYLAQGKYPEAKVEYERALALVRTDPDSELLGHALFNLGTAYSYVGDLDNATKYMQEARARFVATLGPHHPTLGYVLRGLGQVALQKDDVAGAIALLVEATTVFEDANGPDHIDVAIALELLAHAYARHGDVRQAREAGERALALRENKLGKDHISLVTSLESLADADVADGTPAALAHAMSLLERAAAIQEQLGKDHPQLREIHDRMATVRAAQKRR